MLVAAGAADAFAHAAFEGGSPAPGQRVFTPPARIVLLFSESLNAHLSRARLTDAATGRAIRARSAVVAGRRLELTPAARLGRAPYRVDWTSVSTDDGHQLDGSFGFGVRTAAAGGGRSLEQGPLAKGGWLRVPARTLMYVALLLFAGALLTSALLDRRGAGTWLAPAELPDASVRAATEARARALVTDSGVFAAGLAAAVALIESFRAAGEVSAGALRDYLLTGTSGIARIGVVAFVLAALALARRAPRAAALGGAGALACVVASGHANSAGARAAALIADFAHLLAAAVWVGGAAMIVLTLGPVLRRGGPDVRAAVARRVLPRFGAVALPAFAVVVVAGAVNALLELTHLSDLWRTSYGVILAVKIALVGAVAVVAYGHAFRLRGRALAGSEDAAHWRLLRAEPAVGACVLAAAAVLVAFPLPPRQLDAADSALAALPACSSCPLPAPARDELAVAGQGGSRVVAATVRRGRAGLSGTIRVLDFRGRPAATAVRIAGAITGGCGGGCTRFSLPARPARLTVLTTERGRTFTTTLPADWRAGQGATARQLLDRAEATMRSLRSFRETERVTSGPGTFALTRYRLRAPDRLAYSTNTGVETIQIGAIQWAHTRGLPFTRTRVPGGLPFRTRSWFRWTPYARSVQLLGRRRLAGRPVAELALFDPGTPVWFRLLIDERSGRVLREQLVARSRFITHRYHGFDAPVSIRPPRVSIDGG